MKRVLIVVVLVVAAAVLGLWRSHGSVREGLNRIVSASGDNSQAVTGDETRKTFDLKPGARIDIQGINGRVDIQTSDTKTAEIFVRRTADNPSSLRRREMIIEQTSDGIIVRSRQNHVGLWDHLFGKDPKEEVTIKAPRQIALSLRGVNGRINAMDIDGSVEVRGVNGRVELGQATESVEISGVNGDISVGLTKLGGRGVRVSGVNGGIEFKLANSVNADLTARGMNGSVRSEIPEVTVDKDQFGGHYSARIGNGGAPIDISGVNGNVRLTRAGTTADATEPKQNTKTDNKDAKTR
jgi:DUF4097 and DUF4098 domain-containing protein YvlB